MDIDKNPKSTKEMYQLANDYLTGNNEREQDYRKAFYWFCKAALEGYPEALDSMGKCFSDGIGVEYNASNALLWFGKWQNGVAVVHKII